MQFLGKEIGEITAFILIYKGIHYDKTNQKYIFFGMTGIVLVCGILVTVFMVKDAKLDKNYVKNDKGEVMRIKVKVAKDEEPND